MALLHETEVDGVRCFWVDSGRPTLAASLLFRQGSADEVLHESGWLHMLEHLALHDRGGGALAVNGSVSPLVTSFDCHGPADMVRAHLTDICSWLGEPTFAELERERGVLRAESGLRDSAVSRAMTWRYGARGPGLSGQSEPGLGRATAELLTAQAHRVLNRSNAVLVLDGPPPQDLRLSLPDGSFVPPREAVPCDDALPAAYIEHSGLVVSGVVERSVPATVLPALLQRALKETLRDQAGAAYAPWAHYEAVDRKHAVVFAGSDANPELLPKLVPTALDMLRRMAQDGPNPAHVSEYVEAMVQGLSDPYAAVGLAYRAAHAVFEGREPQTLEDILDEAKSIGPESIGSALASFSATMLFGVPGQAIWKDELPMLRQPTAARSRGRSFRHRDWPATAARLTIGGDSVQVGEGDVVPSMSVRRVAGMYSFADGRRTLTCEDGWNIFVDPQDWHRGQLAIELLDSMVPTELQLPHPTPAGAPDARRRMSWTRRWWLGLRRALRSRATAIVAIVAVGVLFVASVAHAYAPGMIGSGFFLYATIKEYRAQQRSASSKELHDNEHIRAPI